MLKDNEKKLEQLRKLVIQDPSKIVLNIEEELYLILEIIEDKEFKFIRTSLSNYLIIRLVSTIESFFKNLIRQAVDDGAFDPSDLLLNSDIKLSLIDINEVKSDHQLTIGKLILLNYNFQRYRDIDKAMSYLLHKKDFLSLFNNEIKKHFDSARSPKHSFDWEEFQELFELRHKIVHEMADEKIKIGKLRRFIYHTAIFLAESWFIHLKCLLEDMKDSKELSIKEYKKDVEDMDKRTLQFYQE